MRAFLVLSVVYFFSVLPSFSAVLTWTGGGSSNSASDPLNWSGSTTPATNDVVIFDVTNATKPCNWDLSNSITIASFTMTVTYSTTVYVTNVLRTNYLQVSGGEFEISSSTAEVLSSVKLTNGIFSIKNGGALQFFQPTIFTMTGGLFKSNNPANRIDGITNNDWVFDITGGSLSVQNLSVQYFIGFFLSS